jgi:hypothetical protein
MARTGRGSEGTSAWWHDFAEFVRHALHAAVDRVEPEADGLESIRARIPPGAGPGDRQVTRRLRRRRGIRRGKRRGGPGTGTQRP